MLESRSSQVWLKQIKSDEITQATCIQVINSNFCCVIQFEVLFLSNHLWGDFIFMLKLWTRVQLIWKLVWKFGVFLRITVIHSNNERKLNERIMDRKRAKKRRSQKNQIYWLKISLLQLQLSRMHSLRILHTARIPHSII